MRFTAANTDGYDANELAELNRMFEAQVQDVHLPEHATVMEALAIEDSVAEWVLNEFDIRKVVEMRRCLK